MKKTIRKFESPFVHYVTIDLLFEQSNLFDYVKLTNYTNTQTLIL